MSAKQDYTVRADGWVAGKWCASGSTVSLTEAEAKYENVALKKDEGPKVERPGSLDDPTATSTDLPDQTKTAVSKRRRVRK